MDNLRIGFWAKDSGNFMSHVNGLNKDQLEAIKNLGEGDRLIMYRNKTAEGAIYYSLRKYVKKEKSVSSPEDKEEVK